MKDDEARYLIEQFNKYVSWKTSESRMRSSEWSLMLAAFAVIMAITSISWRNAPLDIVTTLVVPYGLVIVLVLIVAAFVSERRKEVKEHDDYARRLLILEDHRSRFRSLPSITLSKIVDPEFTAERLEKFLKDSEPSGSPQT